MARKKTGPAAKKKPAGALPAWMPSSPPSAGARQARSCASVPAADRMRRPPPLPPAEKKRDDSLSPSGSDSEEEFSDEQEDEEDYKRGAWRTGRQQQSRQPQPMLFGFAGPPFCSSTPTPIPAVHPRMSRRLPPRARGRAVQGRALHGAAQAGLGPLLHCVDGPRRAGAPEVLRALQAGPPQAACWAAGACGGLGTAVPRPRSRRRRRPSARAPRRRAAWAP